MSADCLIKRKWNEKMINIQDASTAEGALLDASLEKPTANNKYSNDD